MRSFEDYLNVLGAFMSHAFETYDIKDSLAAKILRSRTTESIISLAVCLWCVRLACLTFAPCDSLESLSACMRNVQFGSSEAQTVFILHLSTVYLAYV